MKIRIGSLYRLELLRYLKLLKIDGPVLDIGCHDGFLLENISAPLKIGVDIELPKTHTSDQLIVCADANYLPFKKGFFHQIYLLDVIEHIENDSLLAGSIANVISPEGNFILTTPSKDIRLNPFFLTKAISIKWGHIYRIGYTKEELANIFSSRFDFSVHNWNAPWWRFFYLLIRFLAEISTELTIKFIIKVIDWDKHSQKGIKGYFIISGRIING